MELQNYDVNLLPRGYQKQIAAIVGCSTKTVSLALRHNTQGLVSLKVRKAYHELYEKKSVTN